jgi:S-DNA-T family DNA segregation ATPase FtsK/SpoIIIE
MATKQKTKPKSPPKGKQDFKEETIEKVNFRELLQDERTHKILGTLSILFSFFLFTCFSSYLFTWKEDQAMLSQHGAWSSGEAHNIMGTLGALTARFFIDDLFGIASYLFCTFFFMLGVNALKIKLKFSLKRNIRYLVAGLPVISLLAAVITNDYGMAWGGAVGKYMRDTLYGTLGVLGTISLILIAFLAFVIWKFNPSLSAKDNVENNDEEELTEEAKMFVEDEPEVIENVKKKKKKVADPLVEGIQLIEKEEVVAEEEEAVVAPVELPVSPVELNPEPTTPEPVSHVKLEIKTAESETPVDEEAEKIKKIKAKPYDPILDLRDYKFPTLDLLESHGSDKIVQDPQELENNKNQIINTLKNYDIVIQKISATVGPTVTLYEIIPAAGVRISKIKNLEDDIALSLAALGIRIIAPIPGKGTIGIEVPNARKTIVSMRTLLSADKFTKNNFALPIAIGKKIDNENYIVDLATMPHLLMAGATGQGKSVGLNAILVSLLYSKHPSQLKFVLVDPKKVELSIYKSIENHFLAKLPGEEDAIITDTKKVVHTLNALCIEMDNRYGLLKDAGCRNIREYNEKFAKRELNPLNGHQFLPFIVLVVDEFADLIMTAGKEVEMPITRLAQLARAVGIHLIIATQRPSVNIITGTIKANFPARIAFKVSSKIDSRTILDAGGADQLIGKGDMLISANGEIVRLQCAFVDTPEVDRIVDFISEQRGYPQAFLLPEYIDEKDAEGRDFDVNDKDPLFEDAARLIVSSQSGSTSLLQRRMKLGYNRAGRLMDQLEAAGIVGPGQGSKPRDVIIKTEADLNQKLNSF